MPQPAPPHTNTPNVARQSVKWPIAVSLPLAGSRRPHPEPRVRFRRFGDSGLEYELLAWVVDPADRGQAVDALNTAILKAFRAAGIEIPYPKRDVYIHSEPAGESSA